MKETYQGGSLKFFNQGQVERIHEKTLAVLKEVGVKVENKKALDLFAERGAEVDFQEKIVRLPNTMVEEAIDTAPSTVILYGREADQHIELGGTNVYMGTGGTAVNILDLETGEKRKTTSKDVSQIAKLVQNLDNVDFFVIPVFPDDAGKEKADQIRFFNSLENTTKHIMGGVYTQEGQKKVIDAAVKIAGSEVELRERPFISFIANIMSPLTMERDYTDYFRYAVERGVPVVGGTAPIAGATSPITLPGTIVQTNAEALFMVTFSQLINPGAKVLYGVVPTTMDMRSSDFRFASIEMGMMNAACAELAQYYEIPIYNTAGVSDTKAIDIQTGYEKMSNLLMSALTGTNYIHHAAGLLDSGMTVAYEQYVIDNQMIGMAKRVLRGMEFSEERLAYEDIKEVGPGGNFLTANTTMQYMRSEFFDDQLYEASDWDDWVEAGALDARDKAKEIAREILNKDSEELIDSSLLD
ncbi:trimethylamine methyltransferase family protein [Fuchsiella alkaliacetigena]|uniref:trimethylamine methyltransferase family protein n=1 Tax=Fuchsiella alkaliacetigena TaxID=957042 RepID=UPI00200A09E0|nr:trimethylamine methyltransferase family protein [Fuchsiella alkaliacetigena]MCK8825355.1 trimethylamine methyltransferase family protein [Fuchsiella alkaliacetigena]